MKEKLKGFPKIFALSLEEGIERKANFRKQAEELELDYDKIIEMATLDPRLGDSHWGVPGPDGEFGYGGHLLPLVL